ncbi:hypothetical protein SSYIS1_21780 [Serratia symbiotica]|uniref:Uncharacterized protein n=1 Tax=Serratia symbiotica TaxID=138074 RepID=A0A455VP34_9GAMM|nr:hypothetical protein SSYIS1_21780 [Serratia symbiotica]
MPWRTDCSAETLRWCNPKLRPTLITQTLPFPELITERPH